MVFCLPPGKPASQGDALFFPVVNGLSISKKNTLAVMRGVNLSVERKTALLRIAPYASAIPQKNPVQSKKEYFFSSVTNAKKRGT
jgi:hypothetical protein